jgi:hypothetical protein
MSARLVATLAVALVLAGVSEAATQRPELNYEFFKNRVEPVFLQKREGHTRCYVCHSENNSAFHLEKLSPGANFWTEEQSRKNFELAAVLVVPGDPAHSRLLLHPLAPEAGGDLFHSGGRQFASRNDPDWKVLAEWVNGQTERKK